MYIHAININYYTLLDNAMNFIYNKLNRHITNDLNQSLRLFNNEVVSHVLPSIYEEMNALFEHLQRGLLNVLISF